MSPVGTRRILLAAAAVLALTPAAPRAAEAPTSERVYVDRIEGGRAVLLLGPEGRETVTLPARLLPAGTREGAALDLAFSRPAHDPAASQIDQLFADLFGR